MKHLIILLLLSGCMSDLSVDMPPDKIYNVRYEVIGEGSAAHHAYNIYKKLDDKLNSMEVKSNAETICTYYFGSNCRDARNGKKLERKNFKRLEKYKKFTTEKEKEKKKGIVA
jgi:hypothetical protein